MKLQIGDKMLDYRDADVPEKDYTGHALLKALDFLPPREHLLFRFLPSGLLQEVRPDQAVRLAGDGSDRVLVFRSDRSYRQEIDDRVFEWGASVIHGIVLEKLAGVDPATHSAYLEVDGGQDRPIRHNEEIDLAAPGVERFYTRTKIVRIIVNGRAREVEKGKLTFREIVLLAFPDATFPENTVYTVMFKRGPARQPEGSLVDGDVVRIRNQEIFNVSFTDKS